MDLDWTVVLVPWAIFAVAVAALLRLLVREVHGRGTHGASPSEGARTTKPPTSTCSDR